MIAPKPPQGVLVSGHAGLVINKLSLDRVHAPAPRPLFEVGHLVQPLNLSCPRQAQVEWGQASFPLDQTPLLPSAEIVRRPLVPRCKSGVAKRSSVKYCTAEAVSSPSPAIRGVSSPSPAVEGDGCALQCRPLRFCELPSEADTGTYLQVALLCLEQDAKLRDFQDEPLEIARLRIWFHLLSETGPVFTPKLVIRVHARGQERPCMRPMPSPCTEFLTRMSGNRSSVVAEDRNPSFARRMM